MSISDMNNMLPKTFFAVVSRIGKMMNGNNDKKERHKLTANEMKNFIR